MPQPYLPNPIRRLQGNTSQPPQQPQLPQPPQMPQAGGQRRSMPSAAIPGMSGRMNGAFRPTIPGRPLPGLPTQPRIPELPRVPQYPAPRGQQPVPMFTGQPPRAPGSTMPQIKPSPAQPQAPQLPQLPQLPGATGTPEAPQAPWSDRIQGLMDDPTFLNPDDFYYPGTGRWMQDFSRDDDVTVDGGGPETWGASVMGAAMPDSWMGEVQSFDPSYQEAMQQAYQIGDEELFQALRNEARMRSQQGRQQQAPVYSTQPPVMPEREIFPDDLYMQDDRDPRPQPPAPLPAPVAQPYVPANDWWNQMSAYW